MNGIYLERMENIGRIAEIGSNQQLIDDLIDECNTILRAYTLYKQLE